MSDNEKIKYVRIKKDDCYIDEDKIFHEYYEYEIDIILPTGILEIAENAFESNEELEGVVIQKGCKIIGPCAFYCCYSLEKVSIPNTVEEIGAEAFAGCVSLEELTIPESVKYIGENAFENAVGGCRLTIRTTPGSYAETYAKKHNIKVEYIK